jgi:16S rRNA (cytosine1402-N4)-methyltransferase
VRGKTRQRARFKLCASAVNDELKNIEEAHPQLIELLKPNARIACNLFSLAGRSHRKNRFSSGRAKIASCPPEQPIFTCGHQQASKLITPHPVVPQ